MVSLDCGVLHGGGRGGVRLVQELNHPLNRQRQRPQHAHAAGTACVMETVLLKCNFLKYRPFHKTLPRSSAFVNWVSVRFQETNCTLHTSYLSYCSLFTEVTAFSET